MRASHRAAGGELVDALGADVVAERAQPLDHRVAAALARLAEAAQALVDPLVERIEGVGEDVHVDAVEAAGELDRRDERDAALVGVRLDLEVRGEVVVIADGDDVDAVRRARRR